jgi:cobalt/nickel transport system ATP-binding protein
VAGRAVTVLRLDRVSFGYPTGERVLRGLDLSVGAGRRLAVVGANGAGKTTLLLHLNGILRPTGGRVLWNGAPVAYDRRFLDGWRRTVGMVLQNPDDQLFSASVLEDSSFGPLNLGLSEAAAEAAALAGLEAMDIRRLAGRATHDLSFGEKKRAAIAGVLAARPQVVLLDEPTSGLDIRAKAALMALLDGLHRAGTTLVMATHDLADEAALAEAGLALPAMVRLDRALRAGGLLDGGPARSLDALLARLDGRRE